MYENVLDICGRYEARNGGSEICGGGCGGLETEAAEEG